MSKKTILCVDDEKIVLDSLKAQLKRHFKDGFNYEIALDAEEAMEVIEELSEDDSVVIVIVSDYLMPGIKGDELLVRIHNKYPNITKIMLTGQADQDAIDNAINNANLFGYIHKPWDEKELFNVLAMAVKDRGQWKNQ